MVLKQQIFPGLLALLLLGACGPKAPTSVDPNDPDLNKVKFSAVADSNANTTDYDSGLLASSLALAPGQDFLTINASPNSSNQARLVLITLRAPSNQIKVGATFPLATEIKLGTANATYTQTTGTFVTHAYRASSGTLTIDKIGGTLTANTVDFHLTDAKMAPVPGSTSTGTFMVNLRGRPAIK
jgi:hypothetical protein